MVLKYYVCFYLKNLHHRKNLKECKFLQRLCWPSSYNPFIRVLVNQIPEAFLGAKSLIYVIVCISLEPFSIIHFYMNCVLIYNHELF